MKLFRLCAIILLFVLIAGIAHVRVDFKRTQTGYALTRLRREILEMEEHNRKLKLEIAFLKSPGFLEDKAIKEFGLRHPSVKQIVFLP